MNRLGIFVFYDKDGIVDDYITYLLNEFNVVLNEIIIVCNGKINDVGKRKLLKYSKTVLVRENIGYDAGAWKEVITQHLNTKLKEYDEIVFMNDTFYGPFYSAAKIFKQIDTQYPNVDFWGITEHPAIGKTINAHIQTYFFVVKKDMLHSQCFVDYWNNLQIQDNIKDTIINNELFFTKYFCQRGYKYAVLCNTRQQCEKLKFKNLYISMPYTLLKNYNDPFLKKKSLVISFKDNINLFRFIRFQERVQILQHIKSYYNYPLNFIWDNLNRTTKLIDRIASLGIVISLKNRKSF